MEDELERRSCLALSLRRAKDGTTPGIGRRWSVRWREMGVNVDTSCMRGTAVSSKAVIVLCRYLGFLCLSGGARQSRLKKT